MPLADTATFWFFTWTAPTSNVGDITMYAAINAANGNGANSGDQIYLSQFSFSHSSVGVSENDEDANFKVFPNPSAGIINISNVNHTVDNQIAIVNLMGQIVYQEELFENNKKLDLSNLEKGIYFIKIGKATQRIILH